MYTIYVLDDMAIWQEEIKNNIETAMAKIGITEYKINMYSEPKILLVGIESGGTCDILFSDVSLQQDTSGIDLARQLAEISPRTRIVLVSSCRERMVKGFDVRARYFFVKPMDETKLVEILAEDYRKNYLGNIVTVLRKDGLKLSFAMSDFLYAEQYYGETQIYLANGENIICSTASFVVQP